MDKLYYNPWQLHLSGRSYEVLEEYGDGSKLIRFPSFGGAEVIAKPYDLDESKKEQCEKRWDAERERIARVHGW